MSHDHEDRNDASSSDDTGARTGGGSLRDRTSSAADATADSPDARDGDTQPVVESRRFGDESGDQQDSSQLVNFEEAEAAIRQLPPHEREVLIQSFIVRRENWSAPMPRPEDLGKYEAVLPGAADRILRMSEQALEAQNHVDITLADGDVEALSRGQRYTSIIVGGSIVVALVAMLVLLGWGQNPAYSAIFLSPAFFQFASKLVRAVREPTNDER